MRLAAERIAAPPERPRRGRLVLIHGFTQTRSSWSAIAVEVNRDGYEVISVDAPGHGESGSLHIDLPAGAVALGHSGGPATYVGYSMGGRLALHLAVSRPDLVERLVLVSATAGLDDADDRAARRLDDERRAEELERNGIAHFLDEWLSLPMFATLPPDAANLADRLGNTAAGLAASLRLAGTGAQQSLWPRLDSLTMPVLLVAGQFDAKFTAIAERMAASIPSATTAVLAGAGHAVHLEQPTGFLDVLRRWLDDHPVAPPNADGSVHPPADSQSDRRQRAKGEL